jgi:hypothetical protein
VAEAEKSEQGIESEEGRMIKVGVCVCVYYVYVCVCVYVDVCMYVGVCVCVRERDRGIGHRERGGTHDQGTGGSRGDTVDQYPTIHIPHLISNI